LLKDTEQLTYKYYQDIKRGKTPKTAPTYIENKNNFLPVNDMPKYKCSVCGYIYNSAVGDPDAGIPAGTLFEDIPNDWVCPICGATKDKFKKII